MLIPVNRVLINNEVCRRGWCVLGAGHTLPSRLVGNSFLSKKFYISGSFCCRAASGSYCVDENLTLWVVSMARFDIVSRLTLTKMLHDVAYFEVRLVLHVNRACTVNW